MTKSTIHYLIHLACFFVVAVVYPNPPSWNSLISLICMVGIYFNTAFSHQMSKISNSFIHYFLFALFGVVFPPASLGVFLIALLCLLALYVNTALDNLV